MPEPTACFSLYLCMAAVRPITEFQVFSNAIIHSNLNISLNSSGHAIEKEFRVIQQVGY